jgi:hypothetical protein
MRKSFILLIGVLMTTGLLLAQGHDNAREREARDTLVFAADVRVGPHLLPAGEYRVVCNRQHLSFTQTKGSKATFEVPCQGTELAEPRKQSEVHTSMGPDGVRLIEKLLLKGSNVEHVFK